MLEKTSKSCEVVVLGATGKVGSQLLKFLSAAGISCKAFTRDLAKASPLPGVQWVQGDLNDKESLYAALEGSKKLFLNSGVTDNMRQVQIGIIDTAKELGVEHIVKLSTPSAQPDSKDKVGAMHWHIEEYLKNAGLSWNIVQPQSFMQNWLGDFADTIRTQRKMYSTAGNGKKAFIDARDIAEVISTLLIHPTSYLNQTFSLSGPARVSYYDVADAISKAVSEPVTYLPQTAEEARQRLQEKGVPEWAIRIRLLVELHQKENTANELISNHVEDILGKPARSINAFFKEYAQSFQPIVGLPATP